MKKMVFSKLDSLKTKPSKQSRFVSILGAGASVAGIAFYLTAAFSFLKTELNASELFVSAASLSLALAAGLSSVYFERAARLLRRSPRVFVSYTHDNYDTATRLAAKLRSAGGVVWLDQERIQHGESISSNVERAIREADSLVLLLTHQLNKSLDYELKIAYANNIPVIAAVTNNAALPKYSSNNLTYRIKFNEADESSVRKLVDAAIHPKLALNLA